MCIYAVLAGHSAAIEIAYYVELNFDYFRELLNIEKIPSHDTFSRVLRYTDFKALSSSLGEWLRENFPEIYRKYRDKKALHIDGKAVRGVSEKSAGEKPVYHLNAMYEGGAVGVEIKRVGEKENEISCLPDYLKCFDLRDTVVTMDAIGCNQTVIKEIHGGGDAVTNGSILRRFCMAMKKKDEELSEKPLKRFLMANEHDPKRIEKLLFKNVAREEGKF